MTLSGCYGDVILALMVRESPVASDRRVALDALLASRTFRRADVLRKLLTYLVEQDEAGRARDITEYELGTNVLGRSQDFAPDSDSSVRTRVHALRQKLEEYYRDEAPEAEIRIELPRGGYIPEFKYLSVSQPALSRSKPWGVWALVGFVCAAAVVALGSFVQRGDPKPLAKLWEPILQPGQPVAIVVGQPVHLWVRDIRNQAPDPPMYSHLPDPVPTSERFRTYYLNKRTLAPDSKLVLHPSPNATLWGDAAGAAAAARFLAFRGTNSELIPEATLKSEVAIRGRALLVFGRPEYSDVVNRYLLAANGYTVGMINEIKQYAIFRTNEPGERFLNTEEPHEVNHGLITVLREGSERVMVFSGITSDGSVAGLDYLTDSAAVTELQKRFSADGVSEWPRVFQVVIRTNSSRGYPLAAAYEKHLILKR